MDSIWIILTTVDTRAMAETLAKGSVRNELAACAQIDAGISSFYEWEGKLEEAPEWRIVFKASENKKPRLMDWLKTQHPYETPQILAFTAESGDPGYTDWVRQR